MHNHQVHNHLNPVMRSVARWWQYIRAVWWSVRTSFPLSDWGLPSHFGYESGCVCNLVGCHYGPLNIMNAYYLFSFVYKLCTRTYAHNFFKPWLQTKTCTCITENMIACITEIPHLSYLPWEALPDDDNILELSDGPWGLLFRLVIEGRFPWQEWHCTRSRLMHKSFSTRVRVSSKACMFWYFQSCVTGILIQRRGKVVGLSKLVRVTELFSRRMQVPMCTHARYFAAARALLSSLYAA